MNRPAGQNQILSGPGPTGRDRPFTLDRDLGWPSVELRRILFVGAALGVLLLGIYGNTFNAPYIFDDYPNIVHNQGIHLKDLSWTSLKGALFAHPLEPGRLYRPLSNLSFALVAYLAPQGTLWQHVVNLSIHLLTSLVLFLFLYQILALPALPRVERESRYFLSALTTFLWAAHPIQIQAVTYIVQRMTSLSALFYMLSLYAYLKARLHQGSFARSMLFVMGLLCWVGALGSKENAVMLPFSILLLEALLLRRGDGREDMGRGRQVANGIALLILVGLVVGLLAWALSATDPLSLLKGYEGRPFTLKERLLTQGRVLCFYLSLFFYPISGRFSLIHPVELSRSLLEPWTTLGALLLIGGLMALAVKLMRKEPLISFSILFFFLNHLVESSILPLELVYEHRNYLPSMFLFFPLGAVLLRLLRAFHDRKWLKRLLVAFPVGLLILEGWGTYLRNGIWNDPELFWRDVVQKAPQLSRPHMNLSHVYFEKGRIQEAMLENLVALHLDAFPRNDMRHIPYLNLAACAMRLGRYGQGIRYAREALRLNPKSARASYYLATAYYERKDLEAAQRFLQQSLRLGPRQAPARCLLARIYLEKGDPKKAVQESVKALRLDPDGAEPLLLAGLARLKEGNPTRARELLNLALRRAPDERGPIRETAALALALAEFHVAGWGRAVEVLRISLGCPKPSRINSLEARAQFLWDRGLVCPSEAVALDMLIKALAGERKSQ